MPTIEPIIGQERNALEPLVDPRSTLMPKWEVRAVGRGGRETDGKTIINVPKGT